MPQRSFLRYLTRRLLFAVLLVFLVSSGSLLLAHLAPGDAASDLRRPGVSRETVARERERLGLDRPFATQYLQWVTRAARLDLGQSSRFGRPVVDLLGERMLNTAILATAALATAGVLGVWLGVVSGSRSGLVRPLISWASIVGISIPPLLASLGLAMMAARTGWFPVGGISSIGVEDLGVLSRMTDLLWHLTLPTLAVALPLAATVERLQSQSMTETLAAPYIRAAVARGLTRRRIVWRHAFPVAVRPVVGVSGIIVGSVFSGSFVVEIVSSWPGLGQLMYDALVSRDAQLVAGCAVAGSIFLALGNLASDVALVAIDPRLRDQS